MNERLWILMIVCLAACSSPPGTPESQVSPLQLPQLPVTNYPLTGTPDSQVSPLEAPVTTSPLITPASGTLSPAEKAVVDLAERLAIDPASIQIERVEPDEFPAQELGCAEPASKELSGDRPAFVTGQAIWLRLGDALYEYHSHGSQLVFCGMQQE
ncbi:MAG TPA: hypothetical protein VFL17_24200 [Anaerolineae bacterium]|nr:hypothetical protein [Anaerolineae bacterium]